MASEFSQQLAKSNQDFELLPVFHTCDGFDARRHARSNSIHTNDICEVFKEPITYLFYGRPAFKYQVDGNSSRDIALYPVAFILDLTRVQNIKRIFPFDSGAMEHGLYKAHINRKMKTLDFELEADSSRIRDIFLEFYGGNEQYLASQSSTVGDDADNFESHNFAEMVRSISNSLPDERRATIEIQAQQSVPFGGGCLKGIILPTALRDSQLFTQLIADNALDVESYDVTTWNPGQYFGVILDRATRMTKVK